MRKLILLVVLMSGCLLTHSQIKEVKQINKLTEPKTALEPLHFLASDELKGRSPKRPEIHIAENYIAEYFKKAGVVQIDNAPDYFQSFELKVPIKDSTQPQETINAKNIIGVVHGTNETLKNQYIVLSAHYDHIGVTTQPKNGDSIYNGARDNAIGVTCVLNAVTYFAKYPPKRSILFILYTAEEMGLLGSKYFAEHPVLPLNKIVYNINCDNGGYNDITSAMVIGLGRTSADDDIKKACTAYKITAIPDQVPQLNLFDRSDNVSLAAKGIPAPTFGMGVRSFDDEIKKYYHQLADEVNTFNLDYALLYVRAYILAAKNIADNPVQPTWIKGDKYEEAYKKLYNK
jgi:hypothetical protein